MFYNRNIEIVFAKLKNMLIIYFLRYSCLRLAYLTKYNILESQFCVDTILACRRLYTGYFPYVWSKLFGQIMNNLRYMIHIN